MRNRHFFTIVFLVLTVILTGAIGVSSKDRFHKFTMENGMEVILQENRNAPVVALQMWVKVGSGDERDKEAGMCHFIEHMLFKGTEKRGVREMAREIESLGGTINAYTSYDQTVYHITLSSRYINTGLEILSDIIQYSTFNSSELREKGK